MARKLEIEIVGDSKSFEKALGRASTATSGFGSKLGGMAKTAAKIGLVGMGALGAGAALAGKKMVLLASDAGEVDSKLKVVFGRNLPLASKQIDIFSKATGASRFEMRQQAADMGALLGPILGSKKAAADMSVEFTKLANDLGSFNNVPTADALIAIRAGLVGEAEPLRRFGVLINEAAVKSEAYRLKLAKVGAELTEQQKVQARASLIMKQTVQAQGDATRTAGSMANQLKRLKNNVRDSATEIGKSLIPAALGIVSTFNDVMKAKGLRAKLTILWEGVQQAGRALADKLREAMAMVDWTAVWAAATGIAVGLQRRFEAIDWTVVGTAVGNGIADAMAKAMAATSKFADAFLNAARSIDWVKLGKAMGPGLAAAVATAFVTLMDPAFWAKNWDLALAVGLSLFGGRIVKFAGGLVMKAVAPLTRAGGDMILAVAKGIESFAPRVASAFLAALVGLSGVATRALSSLAGVVRTQFEKLSGLAQFAVKVLGIQAAINVISDFAGEVRQRISALVGWLGQQLGRFRQWGRDLAAALVNAVSSAAGAAVAAAKSLGSQIIEGIKSGIKSGAFSVKDAVVDVVKSALDVDIPFRSPPEHAAMEMIGKKIPAGIVTGILSGKIAVVQAVVDVANAAMDRARTVVEGRGGELGTWLQRAFDARQGSKQTKTELLISKKELEREKARLAEAISSAQADLQAAQVGGDPAAIAAAQRALDDAQYAQWLADAQRQATAERVALEQRQWIEQQNFQKRLGNLQTYLSSGQATAAGAKARILDLMHDFGIQAGNMAQLLGKQFAAGLRKMIPAVAAAAEALRIAVKNEGILLRGRKITIELEEKAEKKKGSEVGATHIAGLDSISTKLHDEVTIGRGMGLSLSSGYRPGDDGDHGKYPSHAIDMSGSGSAMAQFATAMFGRAGTKDVIYGNLNVWQDNGSLVSGWGGNQGLRGDHFDHVHASVFDKGGWLMPGATLAVNNTGVPERVVGPGGGGSEYHFHFPNYVGTRDELVRAVKSGVQDMERNGGSLSRPAPGF